MITPEYCRTMARYNAWQNHQLWRGLEHVPLAELTAGRGAAFGTLLGTLNHILWADRLWLNRLDAESAAPGGDLAESAGCCPTLGVWNAERHETDGRLRLWAERLTAVDLTGTLHWTSALTGGEITRPVALCVVHMFNHQTHHRGQVHAMMTAARLDGATSDLFLMPEILP